MLTRRHEVLHILQEALRCVSLHYKHQSTAIICIPQSWT